jgi:hypothetical protein
MDQTGNQPLSRTRLADDQHRARGVSRELNLIQEPAVRWPLTDELIRLVRAPQGISGYEECLSEPISVRIGSGLWVIGREHTPQ